MRKCTVATARFQDGGSICSPFTQDKVGLLEAKERTVSFLSVGMEAGKHGISKTR